MNKGKCTLLECSGVNSLWTSAAVVQCPEHYSFHPDCGALLQNACSVETKPLILQTADPGTGKTLLAQAVAGEAGVPFFYRCALCYTQLLKVS